MKRALVILILSSVIFGLKGYSQNLSNRGTEFWVGYGHHQFMEPGQSNSQQMILYFSAEPGQPANVTVTVRGRTATQVTNYYVPAGTVIASGFMPKAGPNDCRLYDVPPTFGGNGGEGLFIMSIHIESDIPIVAYAHTYGSASSGATMLMPVETYGYQYVSINSKQVYANNCFSWAYVIASHDNTVVEIKPSVLTRLGKPAGVPFTVTLNKGEVYQIIGANPTNGSTALEVSGTSFKSIANSTGDCYPIAVFSGSSRTTNPISCGSGGGDNDNQQCFPTQAWGKRYLTAPTSRSTAANQFMTNSYKVLVKDPATVVKRNGTILTGLQQNSFYFFESSTADLIEADKPVMVAQFMTGGGCMGGGVGDPEMIYISPLEQGIKRIGFYRNDREAITVNYLTLIIPTNGVSSLRIDGSPTFDHSYAHPRLPGYTIVVKRWGASQSQAIVSSDSAFTAITYGLGSVESYGYNAGTLINNLNAVSAIQNVLDPSTPQHIYTCAGAPVKISALMAYQPTRINWLLTQLGTDISPNTDVVDMSPTLLGTVIQNGITYYKYDLSGTYIFNNPDTFYIPIQAYHPSIENCYNREDLFIKIIVKPKPVADFSFSHTGCELDTVHFSGSSITSNNYTIRDYNWTLPGPTTATGQFVDKLLPAGIHTITLNVVTEEGCVDDTTRNISVFSRPPAEFQIVPASLCEGSQFTITDTASATIAVNEWYWDFGNGITQTNNSGAMANYTYPSAGSYTIKHVAKSSSTCISDTVSRLVTVFSKPSLTYSLPSGCLPLSGLVQFNSNATVSDAQAITNYSWDFGDANANGGNPNTSVLQNPTHNYTVEGTYTIQLSATTDNGCTKDSTFQASFNLKPALTYPTLSPLCESTNGTVSVATATVTNGVSGTGIYYGTAIDAAGNFNPSVAGAGSHTFWYKFTSNANCVDSISQTIFVYAKPVAAYTFPSGCLPSNGQMQFTNTSNISDGQSLSYTWNFGDGAPTSSLNSPIHNYTTEGTFNVNLSVLTNNGCIKDTTVAVVVAITPQLQMNASLPQVCEDAPAFNLSGLPALNGVTGTGLYHGSGITGNGSFSPLLAGDGTHNLWYVFTTTGGCQDSTFSSILVNPKPASSFTVNADICLDQLATINDNSTINSGSISNWIWDFGDGSNATYSNGNTFTKVYSNFNNYTIRLITTSNNGCNDTTTQNIAVHALPAATFTLPASVCMPGGNVAINNSSTIGDNTSLTYSWNFGDGSPLSNQTNPSHIYPAIASYPVTLIVTSSFGCKDTAVKIMSAFFDKPVADFSVTPSALCQGKDNVFDDFSFAPNNTIASWNWNFGDGSSSTTQNPTKRYINPGVYDVQLKVTNSVGCISDVVTKQVIVYLQPVIDAGQSFVVAQGTIIQLRPTANDSSQVSFVWSPPVNLSDPAILRPLVNAISDQTYTLTAYGPGGCNATDEVSVKILKLVKAPNVFSPNGDGINDKWLISNLADYPGAYVEIFNRYGQRIFYSSGYNDPWDGTYNGKPLPVATYYYVITLKNGYEPITGSVTIIR